MFGCAITLSFVVVALNIVSTDGADQHLICKAVDDVFKDGSTQNGSTQSTRLSTMSRRVQGAPGKRGIKGEPGISGLKGEKGRPGIIDDQAIGRVVEGKIRENRELFGRIEALEQLVTKMNSSITNLYDKLYCKGGIIYRWRCYFAIEKSGLQYETAMAACIARGGTGADILARKHQELVVDYMRKQTNAIELWIGMTYSDSTLRWSDGNEVPSGVASSLKWWTGGGYPMPDANRNKLTMGASDSQRGFFNSPGAYSSAAGVLCEK